MRRPWWRGGVVYQVYLRSFLDSDGDGVGDLRGLRQRVDYLAALGVDAVWVSPFFVSPQEDNGYDISDYDRIDPAFGTDDDFDELVAALHSHDIRLVIDLAVNHTSREHPWFLESRSSPDSPKRGWYWWRDRPTNWASYFSGSAWEWDEQAASYYLHVFGVGQPDLNWEEPAVRLEVASVMRRWLDRGVDGFRLDVINFVSKVTDADGELVDAPAAAGADVADGRPGFVNGPRLEEFLHELDERVLSRTTRRGEPVVSIGEMPDVKLDLARRITDRDRGSLDMVFSFEHVDLDHVPGDKWTPVPARPADAVATLVRWQEGLGQSGWNSLYWSNHDQPRAVDRWGDPGRHRVASAKSLATVLHLMRGTPFVYQGEELGLPGAGFDRLEDLRDIESLNHHAAAVAAGADEAEVLASIARAGRDNVRTPMPWTDDEHGGFTAGTPWIAAAACHRGLDARAQRRDPHSVWHHYRRLIGLRHQYDAVVDGDFRMLECCHTDVVAYQRTVPSEAVVVIANLAGEPTPLPDSVSLAAERGVLVLGTHDVASIDAALAAWESRVYVVRSG